MTWEPITKDEREVAAAMINARRAFDLIVSAFPDFPPNAISVGFINFGIQLGCAYAGRDTVTAYLRECADRVPAIPDGPIQSTRTPSKEVEK